MKYNYLAPGPCSWMYFWRHETTSDEPLFTTGSAQMLIIPWPIDYAVVYAKVVCPQLAEIKDVIVMEHRLFQVFLEIEGEHVDAIFTPVLDSSNSSSFSPPAVDSPPFVFGLCFITSFRESLMFIVLFFLFGLPAFSYCRLYGYL